MGPTIMPQKKGHLLSYNSDILNKLQTRFDNLEPAYVFAITDDLGITVEYINLCFLVDCHLPAPKLVKHPAGVSEPSLCTCLLYPGDAPLKKDKYTGI